jgi:hypothetical protein
LPPVGEIVELSVMEIPGGNIMRFEVIAVDSRTGLIATVTTSFVCA